MILFIYRNLRAKFIVITLGLLLLGCSEKQDKNYQDTLIATEVTLEDILGDWQIYQIESLDKSLVLEPILGNCTADYFSYTKALEYIEYSFNKSNCEQTTRKCNFTLKKGIITFSDPTNTSTDTCILRDYSTDKISYIMDIDMDKDTIREKYVFYAKRYIARE